MTFFDELTESLLQALPFAVRGYARHAINKEKGRIEEWLKRNRKLIINYLKTL